MMNFKNFYYFNIILVLFLQLFYNGGINDLNIAPALFSLSGIFILGLFSWFSKTDFKGDSFRLLIAVNVALVFLFLTAFFSKCLPITYIDICKYLTAFLFFYSIIKSIFSLKDYSEFLKILVGFVEIYSICTLLFYFYNKFVAGIFFSGVCFTLYYPYYHATLSTAIIPLAYYLYFTEENKKDKINYFLAILIFYLTVLLTSSRVAQLVLLFETFTILFFTFNVKKLRKESLWILLFFLSMTLISSLLFTDAFHRLFASFNINENYDIVSEDGRGQIYKSALLTIRDNPWSGVGTGLSALYITKYKTSVGTLNDCHNIILNIICDNGLIYFAFFLILVCLLLYVIFKQLRKFIAKSKLDDNSYKYSFALFSSFIAWFSLYFQGFSMPHTYLSALIYVEYIMLALLILNVKFSELYLDCGVIECSSVLDCELSRKNILLNTLIGFVIAFCIVFIVFPSLINVIFYWLMHLTFFITLSICFFNVKAFSSKYFTVPAFLLSILLLANLYIYSNAFFSGAYHEKGVSAYLEKNYREAENCWKKSIEYYPNLTACLCYSRLLFDQKDYCKAYAMLKFYNSFLPYELFGLNNFVCSVIKTRDDSRVFQLLQELENYSPFDSSGTFFGAYLISKTQDYKAATLKYAKNILKRYDFIHTVFFTKNILQLEIFNVFKSNIIEIIPQYCQKYEKMFFSFYSELWETAYNCWFLGWHDSYLILKCANDNKPKNISDEMINKFIIKKSIRFFNNFYDLFYFSESVNFNIREFLNFNFFYTAGITLKPIFYEHRFFVGVLNNIKNGGFTMGNSENYLPHMGLKRWVPNNIQIDLYNTRKNVIRLPFHLIVLSSFIVGADNTSAEIRNYYKLSSF